MQQWAIIHIHQSMNARPCLGGTQIPDFVQHRAQKKVGYDDIEKGGGKII